jgi:hypothetical protein
VTTDEVGVVMLLLLVLVMRRGGRSEDERASAHGRCQGEEGEAHGRFGVGPVEGSKSVAEGEWEDETGRSVRGSVKEAKEVK